MKLKTLITCSLAFLAVTLLVTSCLNDDNLIPANCFDGEFNNGELDVDCGGPNCDPCPPSCTNGILDVDFGEIDVDCGGPNCDACPTCNDGILNQDELGIDCGGENCNPCVNPSTNCTNGILDGDEEGVDCGGPECNPCPEETCEDGIMNNEETGIDCGGPNCPVCPPPTCNDGVMNQDELGIDCGGLFCNPCQTAAQGQIIFRRNNGNFTIMNGTASFDDVLMNMMITGSVGAEEIIFSIEEASLSTGVNINFNPTTSPELVSGYSHPTLNNYISTSSASGLTLNFSVVDTPGGSSVVGTFSGVLDNFNNTNQLFFTEGSINLIVQ